MRPLAKHKGARPMKRHKKLAPNVAVVRHMPKDVRHAFALGLAAELAVKPWHRRLVAELQKADEKDLAKEEARILADLYSTDHPKMAAILKKHGPNPTEVLGILRQNKIQPSKHLLDLCAEATNADPSVLYGLFPPAKEKSPKQPTSKSGKRNPRRRRRDRNGGNGGDGGDDE